jgi:hypothetical protein
LPGVCVQDGGERTFERSAPFVSDETPGKETSTKGKGQPWFLKYGRLFDDTVYHTLALILSIFSIWLIHWVIGKTVGSEAFLFGFGRFRIQYLFDAAHLIVIVRFLLKLLRQCLAVVAKRDNSVTVRSHLVDSEDAE